MLTISCRREATVPNVCQRMGARSGNDSRFLDSSSKTDSRCSGLISCKTKRCSSSMLGLEERALFMFIMLSCGLLVEERLVPPIMFLLLFPMEKLLLRSPEKPICCCCSCCDCCCPPRTEDRLDRPPMAEEPRSPDGVSREPMMELVPGEAEPKFAGRFRPAMMLEPSPTLLVELSPIVLFKIAGLGDY